MRTESAVKPYASAQEESKAFIYKVYGYMAVGLGITGVVSLWLSSQDRIITEYLYTVSIRGGRLWWVPRPLLWITAIASIILAIGVRSSLHKMKSATASVLLGIYSAMIGVVIAPTLFLYTRASAASVFFITGGMFATFSAVGYITKRDLSGVGSICLMALWGIILAMIVNMVFLHSTQMQLVVSIVGVIIFAGLTAYDTQQIKQRGALGDATTNDALAGALELYLNFINIFLFLLRIMGTRRN